MSQIFQFSFPTDKFFDFLEKYCSKKQKSVCFFKRCV